MQEIDLTHDVVVAEISENDASNLWLLLVWVSRFQCKIYRVRWGLETFA